MAKGNRKSRRDSSLPHPALPVIYADKKRIVEDKKSSKQLGSVGKNLPKGKKNTLT